MRSVKMSKVGKDLEIMLELQILGNTAGVLHLPRPCLTPLTTDASSLSLLSLQELVFCRMHHLVLLSLLI